MEQRARSTRTLKVTEVVISPAERALLIDLAGDPRYEALLNVMERACIALETAHFNTSTGDVESILGGHAMAKASWLFFTYVQKQVTNAFNSRMVEDDTEPQPARLDDILQGVG
jgi:hypothetical protein